MALGIFSSLSEILEKARGRHPAWSKRMDEAEAVARWEAAVGETIAKHARAKTIQDSVLWVEVDHAIWRAELQFRKVQILEILNQGKSALTDIFFINPREPSHKWTSGSKKASNSRNPKD